MTNLYQQLKNMHDKAKPHVLAAQKPDKSRNIHEEMDGVTWLRYSISVWDDIRRSQEERELSHPAMFPVELVERAIKVFARHKDDLVIDPFAGSGSTMVAATKLGRRSLGVEISRKFVNIAEQRLGQCNLLNNNGKKLATIVQDDARNLLKHIQPGSAGLCITSPPYWDILTQKRTADYKTVRNYGDLESDLGRIHDYSAFLDSLADVFQQVYIALKPRAYCVVVVMDLRKKDKFYPFHSDLARRMESLDFELDDIIIWNRAHEYNNLRPLGYPHVFRVNKVHEFIMIFQKRFIPKRELKDNAK